MSVALIVIYYTIQTIKKNLHDEPDAKMLRELAISVFMDENGRPPRLQP